MLSTFDFNRYEDLTYQRQTDSSNCYSIFTSIQILRNYNDAYFLLKSHTGNPLIVYANNGKLYKPNCKIIELYTYIIGKHCFKELQIIYKSENNEERGGFLTRDLIIRNTANPIPCEIKSDIIIEKSPNKNIIKLVDGASLNKHHVQIFQKFQIRFNFFNSKVRLNSEKVKINQFNPIIPSTNNITKLT